jgi:murein DD-endopeptidase MepM/ murein hydrolase activator NlpD
MIVAALLVALPLATATEPWGQPCGTVHNPLLVSDRRSFAALEAAITSRFGDGRRSYKPGHLHAGIDLGTEHGQQVHAICPGRVVDIHLDFPHRTVVVEHHRPDGTVFWSSYKHLEGLLVAVGDDIEEITPVGRTLNPEEQARAGWRGNHLHLEIRIDISDEGTASFTSMSSEELERYARDPLPFFEAELE